MPRGVIRDLSRHVGDIAGPAVSAESLARLATLDAGSLPAVAGNMRIGPCVGAVSKFICVGLNYADHAAESNLPVPDEPVLFAKAASAICGPYDDVILPRGATKCDWEVELGVVIGKEGRYVCEADALEHVAGYCVINHLSERAFQIERAGQWIKGKSADTFGRMGPWLVTKDEVDNPQALSLWLEVDGTRYQNGNTSTMIFGVARIVSYISEFMSLQPGVGMGQTPQKYLRPGQTMRLGIDGLGEQSQRTVAWTMEAVVAEGRQAISVAS